MQEHLKHKSLNEMSLAKRMHDHEVITQAFLKGTSVELKTLSDKRKHPFALENIQNN